MKRLLLSVSAIATLAVAVGGCSHQPARINAYSGPIDSSTPPSVTMAAGDTLGNVLHQNKTYFTAQREAAAANQAVATVHESDQSGE